MFPLGQGGVVIMRGTDAASGSLFSDAELEARIAARPPLRKIRQVVNDALARLDGAFAALYTDFGRPSIAPKENRSAPQTSSAP